MLSARLRRPTLRRLTATSEVVSGRDAPATAIPHLDYLCLQPMRQGQASYAHVNEIVAGLRRRGWSVLLIQPPLPRAGRLDGFRRTWAVVAVQVRYWVRRRFRPARFLYVRTHFAALPTAALAKAAGVVVVQELNGPLEDAFDSWPQLRPFRRLLEFSVRTQLRWACAVITVTPGLATYVTKLTGRRDNLYVVGNGADVERFQPPSRSVRRAAQPYVVFVGVLASWQGVDVALDATKVPAWPPHVCLVIAGDGRERGRVAAEATANPRIRWLGTIPYEDTTALVSESLAALVPVADGPRARFGLSPLKLFEAMACGVPVVVSDLPGLGDTVRQHDCGMTFTASDPEALARAVSELAQDPVRASKMGSRGRAAAVSSYSWDARAGDTEDILLIAARRHPGSRRYEG
jgi:glycosyltransferase involved in cell wall biosynthesis